MRSGGGQIGRRSPALAVINATLKSEQKILQSSRQRILQCTLYSECPTVNW